MLYESKCGPINIIEMLYKTNIFGINKSKNRRDITPIRKYKQIQKKKIANNIKKNNNRILLNNLWFMIQYR